MASKTELVLSYILLALLGLLTFNSSSPLPSGEIDRARAYTRASEFNYEAWMANAFSLKIEQGALNLPDILSNEARKQVVMEYLRLTTTIMQAENRLSIIYADPQVKDKESATSQIRAQLAELNARQDKLAPVAEAVVQEQVSEILSEQGLTLGGQPIPPVLYRVSPLPMNLIISRRDRVEQIAAISVQPDLSVDKQVQIEDNVARALDVSTLVVPVGGIGVYPTMVMRTDDFRWQVSVVVHEWVHNYLTLRPLGFLYDSSPEMRIMNETTASIVENELGPLVMARYYPEFNASSFDPQLVARSSGLPAADQTPIDFRAEMHTTRVHVDELLAAGKIQEAETYMEQRRQFFWDHGYAIRKLNQAYFAFYGAYADVPGGAAGEDPVGPAVRALRAQSASIADFLNTISWMTSFDDLKKAIHQ